MEYDGGAERTSHRVHQGTGCAGNSATPVVAVNVIVVNIVETTPPTDPTGLTATTVGSSQINLAWTASTDSGGSGLAGYRIERCMGVSCSTFVQIATPVPNSYSNTGLLAWISYSYRVHAVDGANNVSLNYSNVASTTTQAATGLITAYGMNEGSGTTLADASSSGHTGTLVNGPAWVAGQATYGQALVFDASTMPSRWPIPAPTTSARRISRSSCG